MFNKSRNLITKVEKRNDNSNNAMTMKYVMLSLFTITILLFGPNANASPDSTNMSSDKIRKGMTPQLSPEKNYFILDTGTLGPDRPDGGNSYWNGERATTVKKCPQGYTPSVGLTYAASEQGGGNFYGTVVLDAGFDTTTYHLHHIQAYTIKDDRNGYLTFRWKIYCSISPVTPSKRETPPPDDTTTTTTTDPTTTTDQDPGTYTGCSGKSEECASVNTGDSP
jgi:hypothetical protein